MKKPVMWVLVGESDELEKLDKVRVELKLNEVYGHQFQADDANSVRSASNYCRHIIRTLSDRGVIELPDGVKL